MKSERFQFSRKNLLHLRELLRTAGVFTGRECCKSPLKGKAPGSLNFTALSLALNSLCEQKRKTLSITKTLALPAKPNSKCLAIATMTARTRCFQLGYHCSFIIYRAVEKLEILSFSQKPFYSCIKSPSDNIAF